MGCLYAKQKQTIFPAFFLSLLLIITPTDAYDALDPNGNITIKWDIKQWNPDGYLALVTIFNFQQYRHIEAPGWRLGWSWARKEVIWNMWGAQATDQGDCSRFKSAIPHCCRKDPTIVDLLPATSFNQQTPNCCKAGLLTSWVQDPVASVASFQLAVGQAGTNNKTVRLPQNFTLQTPGPGYTCGPTKIVKPTRFLMPDGRRVTQALMTWNVSCSYSQTLAQKTPTCCVSLSSFYNDTIVNCPTCSCGCQNTITTQPSGTTSTTTSTCVDPDSPRIASAISLSNNENGEVAPLVECTSHMCPVRVHWHVKLNYKEYWRVKVTVTNFNHRMNYSQWNLVAQHPNFDDLTQIFSFNSKPLTPYGSINDTAMLWGLPFYNDVLLQSGPTGNVQSELLFKKDKSRKFTFEEGWGFPRRIYFNGDNCVMPDPQSYPHMPNDAAAGISISISIVMMILAYLVTFFIL